MCLPNSPSVQHGVAACGGHGKDMEAKKGEEVVGPAVEWHGHVFHQVQDVDG